MDIRSASVLDIVKWWTTLTDVERRQHTLDGIEARSVFEYVGMYAHEILDIHCKHSMVDDMEAQLELETRALKRMERKVDALRSAIQTALAKYDVDDSEEHTAT